MKNIGIDTQALFGPPTGLKVYTESWLHALNSEISADEWKIHFFHARSKTENLNTVQRLLWENFGLPRQAREAGLELLHVPAFALPYKTPCRTILTVHDLIGVKFDNQKGTASRFYWKKWLPASLKRADCIIAISEYTKNDIVEFLKIPESKIRVIRPSGHESFKPEIPDFQIDEVKRRLGITGGYFLTVGSFEPRKNLARVIEAFGIFLRQNPGAAQLVMVGPQDFANGSYFKSLCSRYGIGDGKILATGYVNHDTLNALYAGSSALVFASLYEGFGLPLLEAMASGCPVIASQATSLPEVAGHAAEYVNPEDAGDIADKMNLLWTWPERRADLRQKGFARISSFSWKRTAKETVSLYRELLS